MKGEEFVQLPAESIIEVIPAKTYNNKVHVTFNYGNELGALDRSHCSDLVKDIKKLKYYVMIVYIMPSKYFSAH